MSKCEEVKDMYHRTILIQYRQGVSQTDASGMLSAFQNLPGRVNGLVNVSVNLLQGDYDVSIDLIFDSEQARRNCAFDDSYRSALTWARDLSDRMESTESSDGQSAPVGDFGLPMKWHKFLIYFALWAGAVLNLISGAQMFFMGINAGNAWLYEMTSGLRALYIVSGIFMIAIGVFQIFTRSALARFSRRGPRMVVWLYASLVILNALEILMAWLLFGVPLNYLLTADVWFYLIEGVLMTWANQVYYRKRAALFIN